MKNEKNYKYIIIICILAFVLILSGLTDIFWTNKARRQIDQLRGQLAEATESNNHITRELEDCRARFEQCHSILQELGDTTGRSIETIRDCIDLVEEQRYYIACLSYYIDSGSSDELYNRIDDYVFDKGVKE